MRPNDDNVYSVVHLFGASTGTGQKGLVYRLAERLRAVIYTINCLIEKGFLSTTRFLASDSKLFYEHISIHQGLGEKTLLTPSFLRKKMASYAAPMGETNSFGANFSKNTLPLSSSDTPMKIQNQPCSTGIDEPYASGAMLIATIKTKQNALHPLIRQ